MKTESSVASAFHVLSELKLNERFIGLNIRKKSNKYAKPDPTESI